MSKHLMVEGQILQMNKTYSQLKNKQKEKISNWMYHMVILIGPFFRMEMRCYEE